ncbi:hypothetical protein [Mycobacterium riyadhense]|uniref:hypothetical protein n=1 Tax=Mycobacterium riyadhense TaxID=486698 RepID=UPI00195DC128|nr:hypothetical protein [Mycobacterium riyadhense]
MQLRRYRQTDLPILFTEIHRGLRPLRRATPTGGALAGRTGLRPVLHRRAAAPRTLRTLRCTAKAGCPRGLHADTCADCAGLPVTHTCTDCGIEDKLYERSRCARCSLRRRTTALLTGADGQIPTRLAPLLEAICAARNPRSALNWLARSHGAALLADLAAGTLPARIKPWMPTAAPGRRLSTPHAHGCWRTRAPRRRTHPHRAVAR